MTSANAPRTDTFIAYWVAPVLLITLVISAGVIALCAWMWRVMNRGFDSMKRWVDRVGVVADGEVTPSLGRAKKVDPIDEDEPKKKKKSRRR